ncbi:MAG: symmetrical bis(5'-nucleosyl)-tetraphosphatase [Gammaproteobacteria bacterium]|nr:symmetrical bis(5'-nucleosyl)-tetraphosphatase [Gammaproteobacteria bacterium]
MATYAVGDIQGCYEPLARLLDAVNFDHSKDKLLCVGDLVNRGPDSLAVLRLLKSLEDQCVTVLGNHDIHLLALIYGVRAPRLGDSVRQVLDASDVTELAGWLRSKPLMIKFEKKQTILCHAGIYPWWTRQQAWSFSEEIRHVFANEKSFIKLLNKMYSNSPSRWSDELGKTRRLRFIVNAFTRMRFCSPTGHLNFTESGYTGKRRKNRLPWFEIPNPDLAGSRIIFGHWSALGLINRPGLLCLDTGCVWGRHLTMVKLPKKASSARIKQDKIFVAPNY